MNAIHFNNFGSSGKTISPEQVKEAFSKYELQKDVAKYLGISEAQFSRKMQSASLQKAKAEGQEIYRAVEQMKGIFD